MSSAILIYLLTSCASSKKIDFDTAYQFSTYKYKKSIEQGSPESLDTLSEYQLYAKLDESMVSRSPEHYTDFDLKMYEKMSISPSEGYNKGIDEMQRHVKQMSWKEKREIRREIKAELKQLDLSAKNAHETMDVQRVQQVSDLMRWAIIFGSVGLVLLILGAIFTGVLTFFGAIFVVGGAILFVLDVM